MELSHYIHYYIGCDCLEIDGTKVSLIGYELDHDVPYHVRYKAYDNTNWQKEVKPILRRWPSDMTNEEAVQLKELLPSQYIFSGTTCADITDYLLKRGFDLFGLIDAGVAVDAKLIKINSL